MALKFYYGVIKCGKTKDLIKIYNNYRSKQLNPVVIYLEYGDTQRRRVYNTVSGESCLVVSCKKLDESVLPRLGDLNKIDIILVDNGHLLDTQGVEILREIADIKIPVVVFGLRTRYDGSLYPGASEMFRLADRIDEVIDICWCGKRAIMSGAYNLQNFNAIREVKDETKVGYVGVCSEHWHDGKYFKGVFGEDYRKKDNLLYALKDDWAREKLIYEFGDKYLDMALKAIPNLSEIVSDDKIYIEDGLESYDFTQDEED